VDAGAKQRLQAQCKGLYGFALTLARNEDEAHDLVQETALKALAARNVPEDGAAFRVWLFRILHNSWRDRLRRHDNKTKAPLDAVDADGRLGDWTVVHERTINTMAVRASFEKLSRDHQQVIALVDIAGMKYAEAGAVLHCPPGTIMSRLSRARQALLAAMNEATVVPVAGRPRRTGS
jgi:RNA polymerase sigma-70 factor (ECF subfamily)